MLVLFCSVRVGKTPAQRRCGVGSQILATEMLCGWTSGQYASIDVIEGMSLDNKETMLVLEAET